MRLNDKNCQRVRELPLFKKCSDETFSTILTGSFLQRFPSGTILMLESDRPDFFYVLLEGTVELGAGWKSKDTTLAILKPISTFVLAAVVLDSDALMCATTLERSEILMISGDSFRKAMREDAEFGLTISEELSGCYRGVVRSIKSHKLRSATERLANYLLTQRARQGKKATITLPNEKRVVASLLGMTPENLSRSFAKLTKQGVSVDGNKITFTKLAALERLARPSNMIDNHLGPEASLLGKANTERQRGGFGVNTAERP